MTSSPSAPTTPFERVLPGRLNRVQRPARYVGGERGAIIKDWAVTPFRFAYCFPDLYEIGMSYHGREVLYQYLNARADTLCERAFLPARDMQQLMLEHGVALWALESKRPLTEFDAIGISLTHELAYPSALLLIELAGLPLLSADRDESHPLVIAGGQCMCNPEPLAPFIDLIVNGEGEQVLDEIVETLLLLKDHSREQCLLALTGISGCYVPRYYAKEVSADGQLPATRRLRDDVPARISRRYVADLSAIPPPVDPVQSYLDLPSDKASLEVMRGCPQGCRFCQAGYITRPARVRPVRQLAAAAAELQRNTGSDEISLLSLSTLDYPDIHRLVSAVRTALPADVGVALPSLRADAMSAELAQLVRRPRETSLTVAIEAGDEQRRTAINKRVTDSDIRDTFKYLLAAGWHKFKLYFMCGFAGEPLEAMDAIAATIADVLSLAREGGYRRPQLRVTLSVLVPKAHTPLQWQAMEDPELTAEKQRRLRRALKKLGGNVRLHWHDPRQAVIEALLSRGGRELAGLLEAAMRAGQTLLSDNFEYSIWERLLAEHGVDLQAQVFRERALDEPLPWDHIDRGVRKDYLWKEWQAYQAGESTPPCHEKCRACGLGCAGALFSAVAAE